MITDAIRTHFSSFLDTDLNDEQRTAVTTIHNVLLVIAGAGSGKTRVITARITHLLLNCGVPASAIIALTFTNKAAREMRERIELFTGNAATALPFIGTFHGYCVQMLKRYAHLSRIPNFTIMDEEDQEQLLGKLLKQSHLHKKMTAGQLAHRISQLKNASSLTKYDNNDPLLHELYMAYEAEKERACCFDFDDLLLEVRSLFKHNAAFAHEWRATVRHILVDEYQDTNHVQHELLTLMANSTSRSLAIDSLCVVGDEDQSIYSWRGATVTNIINFNHDFPSAQLITIERNYRSCQPILDAANHVISNNKQRNPKKLWSQKTGTNCIAILGCNTEYQEGEAVALLLNALHDKLARCAVLYRAHYQSRALEEAFIKYGIPYRIIGGIQFYARKEIKDILAYARLLVNPADRISCLRIINTPTRGLGDKFEELLQEQWAQHPQASFLDILHLLMTRSELTRTKKQALEQLLHLFATLGTYSTPHDTLHAIVQGTGYFAYLQRTYEQAEATSKIENVKELLNASQHFYEQGITTISDFLTHITLFQEQIQADDNQNIVQLMTLHAAKGLEFDTVAICGVEEGLLPSARSMHMLEAFEEERRLLYVGITRARERLLMTHAQARRTYGSWDYKKPSSFLKEIPGHLYVQEDAAYWSAQEMRAFFMQWLGRRTPNPRPANTLAQRMPLKPASSAASSAAASTATGWKQYQSVMHTIFGNGIIQAIEQKSNGTVYLTIQFKKGKKTIDAAFIKPV